MTLEEQIREYLDQFIGLLVTDELKETVKIGISKILEESPLGDNFYPIVSSQQCQLDVGFGYNTTRTNMNTEIYTIVNSEILPDVPTSTGRIYSKEVLQSAVNDLNSRVPLVCTMLSPASMETNIEQASHVVIGAQLKADGIHADIQIMDTPEGLVLKHIINEGTKSLITGHGTVNEKNEVADFSIVNVGIDNQV